MEQKYDVFISYSRKDYVNEHNEVIPNNIVSQIKTLFQKNNISYWFDEDGIYSGDEFAPIIAKAIKESKIFLFISTENANKSDWTSSEIATAHVHKKKIIPFRVDDTPYNDAVILYIAKLDYIDYQANPSKAFAKLQKSVGDYLTQVKIAKQKQDEGKNKEAERKKRQEELAHVQRRIVKVSADMEEVKNQWQILTTQYNDLKSKEATLLGQEYNHTVETLSIPKVVENNQREVETQEESSLTSSKKNRLLRIAQWFVSPDGKVRSKIVSVLLNLSIIFSSFIEFLLLDPLARAIKYENMERIGVYIAFFSFALVYATLLYLVKKWKRLALYLCTGLPCLFFIFVELIEEAYFTGFTMLAIVISILITLLSVKYKGKSFFEQTECVKQNLGDKSFWKPFKYTGIALLVSYLFIGLYAAEFYGKYRWRYEDYYKEQVFDYTVPVPDYTTEPVEEAAPDSVAATE